MDIEDFVLDKAILEIRYAKAFLFWDQVGTFWASIEKDWPMISNLEASPAKTVFRLGLDCAYELVAELSSARVVAYEPKANLNEFKKVLVNFFTRLCDLMKIQYLNRIGFRLQFRYKTNSFEECKELVNSTNISRLPKESVFGFGVDSGWTETVTTFSSEDLGVKIILAPQKRTLNVDPPLGFHLEKINREEYGVIYDIDYYTISLVDIAQISFADWIDSVYHQVRRDSTKFLNRGTA